MNYIGLSTCDAANGPGMRVSLFCSGCTLHCKGCFNPESWDFKAGKPFTDETLEKLLKALEEPFVSGLSLLGGDPLEPANEPEVLRIVKAVRERFGDKKTIWLWTGRKYEKVAESPVLKYVDTIVDGPFIERFKVQEQGSWFGSTNQRVIPLKNGKAA
jgi:anaerobic ribonucleoside-triphosphate reductase activating protein